MALPTKAPVAPALPPEPAVDYGALGYSSFDDAPFVIISGASGVGKTIAAALAYSGAHFISASPTGLHSYAAWCIDNWDKDNGPRALGLRTPVVPNPKFDPTKPPNPKTNPRAYNRPVDAGGVENTILPAWGFDAKGAVVRNETRKTLSSLFCEFASMARTGTFPWEAIVIDEYTEFMRRIEQDIDEDNSFKFDHYARMDAVKAENDFYCDVTRILGVPVIALCHYRDVLYHDKETDKGAKDQSPATWYGKIKYKAGPGLPMGKMLEPMVQRSDLCFTMVEESVGTPMQKRVFLTNDTPERFGKRRGGLDIKEPADLKAAIRKAHYRG